MMTDRGAAREPFADVDRQREAERFGMLVFLASEILLFGGIFAAAMALRLLHPANFVAGARDLHLGFGTASTAVLLTSSTAAALAVVAAREGRGRAARRWFTGAAALGAVFLGIKFAEYAVEFGEGVIPVLAPAGLSGPDQTMFMTLYFTATGLHALHVLAGIATLLVVALRRATWADESATAAGNAALYWHVVDVIWVFLFASLYLAR